MSINEYGSSSEKSFIKIAFVGHTNVGKTTTIRTLMKQAIGEVGDRPNVTQRVTTENYTYEGLQAHFIDTPGFQEANIYLTVKENGIPIEGDLSERLKYDIAAFDAIAESDIVFFLASLDYVPDGSHEQEVKLVASSGKSIIALLNKGVRRSYSDGSDKLENRVEQWRKVLNRHGIIEIFEFDAHWYISSKVAKVYKSVERLLPEYRREIFKRGLKKFEAFHHEIYREASCLIVDCMFGCQKELSVKCRPEDNFQEKQIELATKFSEEIIGQSFVVFLEKISKLFYEVTVHTSNPGIDENTANAFLLTKANLDPRDILLNTGAYAGGAAVYAAAIGAVVGIVASSALTGGLGAVGGAWLGTQVGSAIGSFLGGAVGLVDTTRTRLIYMSLPNDALVDIEIFCMTIVWALSQHGYGLGAEVSTENLERRRTLVKENTHPVDWRTAEKDVAVQHCEQILQRLADISPYSLNFSHG
jgi:GTPase Era involved in 16S rRNA processing